MMKGLWHDLPPHLLGPHSMILSSRRSGVNYLLKVLTGPAGQNLVGQGEADSGFADRNVVSSDDAKDADLLTRQLISVRLLNAVSLDMTGAENSVTN